MIPVNRGLNFGARPLGRRHRIQDVLSIPSQCIYFTVPTGSAVDPNLKESLGALV